MVSRRRDTFNIRRSVDLYWTEKFLVVLQFLQWQALLWTISKRWPWPEQWLYTTSFVLFANLDLYSWTKERGMSISNGYYTAFLSVLPLGIVLLVMALKKTVYRRAKLRHKELMIRFVTLKRWGGYLAEMYYIPFLVHVLRVWPTECRGGKMTYFDSVDCLGFAHITSLIFTFVVAAGFVIVAPLLAYRYASKMAIYRNARLHERSLQSREVEYVLELSNLYENEHSFVGAPFQRKWLFSRCMYYVINALAVVIAVLGQGGAEGPQIIAFLILQLVIAVPKICYHQYRCASTNLLAMLFDWTTIILTLIGSLSYNNERNALFVDKTLTTLLRGISIVGVGPAVLLLLYCLYKGWSYTISKKNVRSILLDKNNKTMIDRIDKAAVIIETSSVLPPEFVDRDELRKHIRDLHAIRMRPENEGHILEWTVQDTIKSLILLYENSENLTLLPNRKLVAAVKGVSARLHKLDEERVVVHPDMQEFFNKLLVMRFLLPDKYIDGKRSDWEEVKGAGMNDMWIEEMGRRRSPSASADNLGGRLRFGALGAGATMVQMERGEDEFKAAEEYGGGDGGEAEDEHAAYAAEYQNYGGYGAADGKQSAAAIELARLNEESESSGDFGPGGQYAQHAGEDENYAEEQQLL